MPITPRILDDLNKGKASYSETRTGIDIDIVDIKSPYSEVVMCPACNRDMLPTTDKFTGRRNGFMCPECGKIFNPIQETNKVEVKRKRMLTTEDHGINESELAGRREITTVKSQVETIRDDAYTNKMPQKSLGKIMDEKLGYAGKKKKDDPDEALLKAQGFTIVESTERLPT